jgi:hypothetical protein
MLNKVFEWLVALILVLALLPCIVSILLRTIGPLLLVVAIIALIAGAFRSHERTRSRASASRKGAGVERTPVLPQGDH